MSTEHHTIGSVGLADGSITIHDLRCEDSALAELLGGHDEASWPEVVNRALSVGARGLMTMGLGVSLTELDERLRATLAEVTGQAEACAVEAVAAAQTAFEKQLDPEVRSSLIGRTIDHMGTARDQLLDRLNPDLAGSDTAKFIAQLIELLGPSGELESRLREALDPDSDGSALARFGAKIETRFQELRDLVAMEHGKSIEAEKGTAKGAAFEDRLEAELRQVAAGLGGCVVERTGTVAGSLGSDAKVGDFVVTLPTGKRIVIEAKNIARLDLMGNGGILSELDRAMENRDAQFAICISSKDAFPQEVGQFGIYGNRLLVVEDGDGVLTGVAMRWASAMLTGTEAARPTIDTAFLLDRIDRVRAMAQRFSTAKRTLDGVRTSVETVRENLDGMRGDLLDLVEDVRRHVQPEADVATPLQVA